MLFVFLFFNSNFERTPAESMRPPCSFTSILVITTRYTDVLVRKKQSSATYQVPGMHIKRRIYCILVLYQQYSTCEQHDVEQLNNSVVTCTTNYTRYITVAAAVVNHYDFIPMHIFLFP